LYLGLQTLTLGSDGPEELACIPQDAAIVAFAGVRIEGVMREGDDQPFAVACVEPGLAAFGPVVAVRRAIDTKAGEGSSMTSNADMMALIRDIDAGEAWAAGRFDAMTSARPLPQKFASQLPPSTWFAALQRPASPPVP
jgi:hypothetical protein